MTVPLSRETAALRGRCKDQSSKRRRGILTANPFTVVDLFAGAGGISEGFRQAGFAVIAGSDNDPDAAATFALNFPEAEMITGDIRTPAIKEKILDAARRADVLIGGPPCQAFSQVRNHSRLIDDARNSLYREFVDVLSKALPTAFVLENVTGMDQMGVREQIADDLALDGEYAVECQVVDAADFGVPQTRKRLLFVGVRSGLGMSLPRIRGTGATELAALARATGRRRTLYRVVIQPTAIGSRLAKALSNPNDASVVTALDALSDLAGLKVGNRRDEISYAELGAPMTAYQRAMRDGAGDMLTNVQVPRINRDTELRLRGIPQGGNYRDLGDVLLERYITGQRWGQDNGTGRLSRRHFYAYRRLHSGIWAWTLNTKADSVYHYGKLRALSVREFARLQSFPDRFIFTTDPKRGMIDGRHEGGPAHSRYRQAGNAVPPLLARSVAESLLLQLNARSERETLRAKAG